MPNILLPNPFRTGRSNLLTKAAFNNLSKLTKHPNKTKLQNKQQMLRKTNGDRVRKMLERSKYNDSWINIIILQTILLLLNPSKVFKRRIMLRYWLDTNNNSFFFLSSRLARNPMKASAVLTVHSQVFLEWTVKLSKDRRTDLLTRQKPLI
jgi:hypothetical protein